MMGEGETCLDSWEVGWETERDFEEEAVGMEKTGVGWGREGLEEEGVA